MNWFKRHLNWTLLIASTLIPLIMLLLAYFVNESLGSTFPKIIGWTLSILLLVIYGWVLRQKKRSLWWLLLWWYPIGCFIYIGLSNKNESSNLGVTNSVLVKEFQEEITPKLKWLYIGDIPDFPLSNFDEVKSKISTGIYSIGIDYTTANQLSRWLYGTGHKNLVVFLASTPVFICIISIVLSIVLGNYWLLFGIAIGILGFFMANPYNPARNFWLIVVVLVVIGMVIGAIINQVTIYYLCASFVVPFYVNGQVYSMNQAKLRSVALSSEPIFLYLYQNGKLGVKNNNNGQSYWHFEFIK